MGDSFHVIVELATPLILSGETHFTLDALLSGVIFEATSSIERALAEIPLDRTHGVWHGSSVFLDSCAIRSSEPFKAGLGMRDIESGSLDRLALRRLGRGERRGEIAHIDTVRGQYQSTLAFYGAYLTPQVHWFGCGQIDAVEALLRDVPGIGKKRRQGYGQVAHIEIEPIDVDVSLSRIVGGERIAMRPITLEDWEHLYGDTPTPSVGCTRSAPPYFQGEAHMCAIPPAREVFWAKHDKRFVL
jgi:CRISPR type IV-associated protein Csf3